MCLGKPLTIKHFRKFYACNHVAQATHYPAMPPPPLISCARQYSQRPKTHFSQDARNLLFTKPPQDRPSPPPSSNSDYVTMPIPGGFVTQCELGEVQDGASRCQVEPKLRLAGSEHYLECEHE